VRVRQSARCAPSSSATRSNCRRPRKQLGDTGLGLVMPGEVAPRDQGYMLAVPNSLPLVAQLFQRTDWAVTIR